MRTPPTDGLPPSACLEQTKQSVEVVSLSLHKASRTSQSLCWNPICHCPAIAQRPNRHTVPATDARRGTSTLRVITVNSGEANPKGYNFSVHVTKGHEREAWRLNGAKRPSERIGKSRPEGVGLQRGGWLRLHQVVVTAARSPTFHWRTGKQSCLLIQPHQSPWAVNRARRSAALCVIERGRMAPRDEQSLRSQQPSGDLAPRLHTGFVDQPIPLAVSSSASEATSATSNRCWPGERDVGGPFGGAKTRIRRFRKGPKVEMLVPSSLWVNT